MGRLGGSWPPGGAGPPRAWAQQRVLSSRPGWTEAASLGGESQRPLRAAVGVAPKEALWSGPTVGRPGRRAERGRSQGEAPETWPAALLSLSRRVPEPRRWVGGPLRASASSSGSCGCSGPEPPSALSGRGLWGQPGAAASTVAPGPEQEHQGPAPGSSLQGGDGPARGSRRKRLSGGSEENDVLMFDVILIPFRGHLTSFTDD